MVYSDPAVLQVKMWHAITSRSTLAAAPWSGGLLIVFGIGCMTAAFGSLSHAWLPQPPPAHPHRLNGSKEPASGPTTRPVQPEQKFEIQFAVGSARPPKSFDGRTLGNLLKSISECRAQQVLVEGHSDHIGGERRNLQLSWRRARAIANILTAAGVDRNQLVVRAFGQYAPKIGAPLKGRIQRRVEVRISDCRSAGDGP